MTMNFTHVFAERDNFRNIIDIADPVTGRSAITSETLEDIRKRYPTAEMLPWSEWQARAAADQQSPIVWSETTPEIYSEMLDVLPPAVYLSHGFLVGEPCDHDFATGRPRFAAYRLAPGGKYLVASRPLTIAEFRAATEGSQK